MHIHKHAWIVTYVDSRQGPVIKIIWYSDTRRLTRGARNQAH